MRDSSGFLPGLVIGVMLAVLSNAAIDTPISTDIVERAESVCSTNSGVKSISQDINSVQVVCNNTAEFSLSRFPIRG